MHGLEGNWTPYGGMQIAEDYQAFNLGIGKDLGLFGAFSFDITQANTTLADGTRHSGQSVSLTRKIFHSGIITTNLFAISQTITRITPTLRT